MKPLETHNLGDLYEIELNGKTVRAVVTTKVYFDEWYTVEDYEQFENEAQKQAYIRKLERNELTPCGVVVEARALGCEGSDSLWAVMVSKPEDVTDAIEDNEMIQLALDDLKANVLTQIETLKPYSTAYRKLSRSRR